MLAALNFAYRLAQLARSSSLPNRWVEFAERGRPAEPCSSRRVLKLALHGPHHLSNRPAGPLTQDDQYLLRQHFAVRSP